MAGSVVKRGQSHRISLTACSIRMLSCRPIWNCCASHELHGPGRSSRRLGPRSTEPGSIGAEKLRLKRSKMRRTTAAKLVFIFTAALVAASVNAQTRHRREREPKETERPAPAVSVDKRDTVVTLPGAYNGRPY